VSAPANKKDQDNKLGYDGKSLYAHLVPILCKEYSIPFSEQFISSIETEKKNTIPKKHINLIKHLHETFGILKVICSGINKKNSLNILQLNDAYNGFDIVKNAVTRGHNAYLLKNEKIIKFYRFGFKILDTPNDEISEYQAYNWNQVARSLERHELIEWINKESSLEVDDIVLPRLKYFISKVCPELLGYYKVFRSFYDEEQIDVVLSPYMQNTRELAAILAANKCENIKTICLEHGDDIFKDLFWRIKELKNFDLLIVSGEENKLYLESIQDRYNIQTEIYTCPNRILNVLIINKLRNTKKYKNRIAANKNTIVFLPTFFMGDTLRIDSNIHLSPTRYYKFQKALLDYFAQKQEYTFIWKGLFVSNALYNPIPDYIRDNKINNVKIKSDPFQNYLPSAYKVICDYPSTGMYESVIAGVPTMCLCSDTLKIRKSGLDEFKNIVKIYSNFDEAINYIEQFLNTDPKQYTADLEIDSSSLIDIIESACNV